MGDIFSDYEGEWMFVKAGGERYIGRYVSDDDDDRTQLEDDLHDGILSLQPVLSYYSEYVQDEKTGNIARQLLITPVELCVGFKSSITLRNVDYAMFFKNMSDEDRREYEKAVRQGVDNTIQARAAKCGLTLESSMPKEEKSPGGIIFS